MGNHIYSDRSAGQILDAPDYNMIDDFISDMDLSDHRDEILSKLSVALDALTSAVFQAMTEEIFGHIVHPYLNPNGIRLDYNLLVASVLRTVEQELSYDYIKDKLQQ